MNKIKSGYKYYPFNMNIFTRSNLYYQNYYDLFGLLFYEKSKKEAYDVLCLKVEEYEYQMNLLIEMSSSYSTKFHFENNGKKEITEMMSQIIDKTKELKKLFASIDKYLKEKDETSFIDTINVIEKKIIVMRDHMKEMEELFKKNGFNNLCGCGCIDCYEADIPDYHCGCEACGDFSDSELEDN